MDEVGPSRQRSHSALEKKELSSYERNGGTLNVYCEEASVGRLLSVRFQPRDSLDWGQDRDGSRQGRDWGELAQQGDPTQ